MKKILFYALLIASFLSAVIFAGIKYNGVKAAGGCCGAGSGGSSHSHNKADLKTGFWGGKAPAGALHVGKVADILKNGKNYAGKSVIVSGTVANECPDGCWLEIRDGSGKVRASLEEAKFNVPQIKGSKVKIYGKVKSDGKVVEIIGQRVELEK
ncbi:MAG: hypothetical protein M1536_03650 [Firmicutes bacterium]|nr:hypothetical protein [Bacillota bacterium]